MLYLGFTSHVFRVWLAWSTVQSRDTKDLLFNLEEVEGKKELLEDDEEEEERS